LTGRPAALLTLLFLVFARPALAAPADSLSLPEAPASLVSKSDVALAVAASFGVLMVTHLDDNLSHEVPESNSAFARHVSSGAEKIGNPVYLAPLLGATWLAGKASGHPGLSSSALRIAGGIAASAAVSTTLKVVAGRARPSESPDDIDEFHAFSGHTAFPSGHTTVAFSLASGIDHETKARWVPFVVYPLAGLVGWSRLRDNRHWASDVFAGALVGVWTTRKFQALTRQNSFSLDLAPGYASATYRF
jgi:membrane-associated phospholipid phosphatase